ncbi:MFS transporter [Streptomyces sp. NPDC057702]|uniref:MFS transporter n=1 Tax=unclassified Streptomyces TaxID=2593676 RepID=UPI00368C91DC
MTTVDPARAEQDQESAAGLIRVPAPRRSKEDDGGSADTRERPGMLRRITRALCHPVPAALVFAGLLHLVWVLVVANSGGDMAAQDAWAEFALQHPGSAYNLAWYGGMHPVSYSVISPYLMAVLGVRTTMVIAGTLSAGLVALLLVRSRSVRKPLWPALYAAFALVCNAISGRVTFGLGTMFGLAALAVIFAWPTRWRSTRALHKVLRWLLAALLAALATMGSPVAGLFVGVVAAALWLTKRRWAAYALGITPTIVVALSWWLFPFSGEQPMSFWSAVLPFLCGVGALVFSPPRWRTVRFVGGLYALAVLLAWLIPSQIGSNITRLGMLFGGVVLIAALPEFPRPSRAALLRTGRQWVALASALVAVTVWQGFKSADDIINTTPSAAWARELAPLLDQFEQINAKQRGRVEVVPAKSHRESSALLRYVNLARGWNRQADLERNPIFYDDSLTPHSYRAWLNRWAVHYVVLPAGKVDNAGEQEAELITEGLPYLREMWSNASWKLYAVENPTPVAEPPGKLVIAEPDQLTLTVDEAGPVLIRVPYSPWLGLVDDKGKSIKPPKSDIEGGVPVNLNGCLTKRVVEAKDGQPEDEWTVLHAPYAGTYHIAAPYQLPRGTPCPDHME